MLDRVKIILGITDTSKDDLLQILIDQVINEIATYTHNPDCVRVLSSTICDMVVFKYNRLGTEGVSSESYSGVNFNYATDYPESILRSLRSHRRAIFK